MKFNHPGMHRVLGVSAALAARAWRHTLDARALYFDPAVDAVHPRFAGRCVYAAPHEYMLLPIILRAGPHMLALASRHRDGAVIDHAMRQLGWSVARGSTTRGGTAALLAMLRDDRRLLILTPDGPSGPRRSFSPGAVFLASKLGLPLVCVGLGYDRPWRLRSWDRFAIPRPFSRCRAVFGPALRVPPDLDRGRLERHRAFFERHLAWLTDYAERWAESGETHDGELRMLPGKASPEMLRFQGGPAYRWPDALADEWAALGAACACAEGSGRSRENAA